MTFIQKVINADSGDADHVGGNSWDTLDDFFDDVATGLTANVNSTFNVRSNKLRLWNPAKTFTYQFNTSAIVADRIITYPLLTANDEPLFKTFAATVLNKTVETDNNTIKDSTTNAAGDLLKGNATKYVRFARGTALQVLRVNSGGTDLEWAAPSGGGDVFLGATNDFGDFDNSFKDNRLRIWNPADTFRTTIVNSAIAANRNLTIPLLTADDTFAVVGMNNSFSEKQTITKDQATLFTLYRTNSTNGSQVHHEFNLRDSANNETIYGRITGEIIDNTDTSEDGTIRFYQQIGGTLTQVAFFGTTGTWACGGPNRRVLIDETGLTAQRSITFQDVASKQAALAFANIFTEPQTISKSQALQLTAYRPANTVGNLTSIAFDGQDSAANQQNYVTISGRIGVNTNGAETGAFLVDIMKAGSLTNLLWMDLNGLQISQTGSNYVVITNTGLTADRTLTFKDATYRVAAENIANSFAQTQTFQDPIDMQDRIMISGKVSPSQITADQNNYAPSSWNVVGIVRLDANNSMPQITGWGDASQADGWTVRLRNVGSNTILLKDAFTNKAASSTAANRFDFGGYDYPLFPKNEIALEYDGTLARWITIDPHPFIIPSPLLGYYYVTDFNVLVSTDGLVSTAASGGSNSSGVVAATAGHTGNVRMTLGTSATGSGSLFGSSQAILLANNWYWRYDIIVKFNNLSDGTNTYTIRFGWIDSTTAESTDGVFFRYTHSVNSGKWVLVARSNSTETAVNATNTAVAASQFYRLTIIVNPAGNSAEFFQDGTYLGEVTTNIPTGAGRVCSFGTMFLKSAGTTNNDLCEVDLIDCLGYTNTPRSV